MQGQTFKAGKEVRTQWIQSHQDHEPRAFPPGMTKWPRSQDRRRLDPKPLTVTVQGVVVYKREYQEHSDAAEAAWRRQDREDEENEKEDEKRNVAGAAFYRILCEEMEAVDAEVDVCTAKEKDEKENEEAKRKAAGRGRR